MTCSKSKIEWTDFSINPIKGKCPMACTYCYAHRLYDRFKWNPKIRWEPEHLLDLELIKKPSRIFIGSTMELFGDWVKQKWLQDLFYWWIPHYPQHIFIFLTKCPENLIKWSPFPENCWVGASATEPPSIREAFKGLEAINATVKFVSFEPLLGMIFSSDNVIERYIKHSGVNWIICGQQTPISKATRPKSEWIQEIIDACDKAQIPIFIKNNIQMDEFSKCSWNRQEFPR